MSVADDALEALLRDGRWVSGPVPDAAALREELRRAARVRGVGIRTSVDRDGRVVARRTGDRGSPAPGRAGPGRRRGWWGAMVAWLTWKRAARIGTVVLGAFSIAGIVFQYVSSRGPTDPVARCHEAHPEATGKPSPSSADPPEGAEDPRRVTGCTSPGTLGADAKGLWVVDVVSYGIPGTALAERYTYADLYSTGCAALTLDYQFDNQGLIDHVQHKVQVGQIVSMDSGRPVGLSDPELQGHELPDPLQNPSAEDLTVLANGRYELFRVDCTSWP